MNCQKIGCDRLATYEIRTTIPASPDTGLKAVEISMYDCDEDTAEITRDSILTMFREDFHSGKFPFDPSAAKVDYIAIAPGYSPKR